MTLDEIEIIRRETQEVQSPYFEDGDIEYYYEKNGGNLEATIYDLLLVKAEDSTISVSGLSTSDTSAYFRRLASRHRQYNSGVVDV